MFDKAVRGAKVATQLFEKQRLVEYCLRGYKLEGDGFALGEISLQGLLFSPMAIYQLEIPLTLVKQPIVIRECPGRLV